jgi:hypothetical protein
MVAYFMTALAARSNSNSSQGASLMNNTTDNFTQARDETILRRFGSYPFADPDADVEEFWESACRGMVEEEEQWRLRGQVFSWIDIKPDWLSLSDWFEILENPERVCIRRFRLSLIAGGQIKVTENFKRYDRSTPEFPPSFYCFEPILRVQAETDAGLRTCNGVLSHAVCYEMSAHAVVFPSGTPQEIADRTATTLRLIGNQPDNFYALLARGLRCSCCGRPLKDEVSKLLGVGPSCAKEMGIAHNVETANRVLACRRELLGITS